MTYQSSSYRHYFYIDPVLWNGFSRNMSTESGYAILGGTPFIRKHFVWRTGFDDWADTKVGPFSKTSQKKSCLQYKTSAGVGAIWNVSDTCNCLTSFLVVGKWFEKKTCWKSYGRRGRCGPTAVTHTLYDDQMYTTRILLSVTIWPTSISCFNSNVSADNGEHEISNFEISWCSQKILTHIISNNKILKHKILKHKMSNFIISLMSNFIISCSTPNHRAGAGRVCGPPNSWKEWRTRNGTIQEIWDIVH